MTTPSSHYVATSPRRFRFGLRSLFALVTVASIVTAWVTYSLNWISQRREMRKSYRTIEHVYGEPHAPGGLWILGEQCVDRIILTRAASDDEIKLAIRLFPEASIETEDSYPPGKKLDDD